jgi:hypothetical protein
MFLTYLVFSPTAGLFKLDEFGTGSEASGRAPVSWDDVLEPSL